MAYNAIPDANIQPGKPLRSVDLFDMRDNPIAIANGDSGAPPIKDAALDTGAATTAGTDWVNLRIAASAVGAIGTYACLLPKDTTTGNLAPGSTLSGSSLLYGDASATASTIGPSSPSGTWRLMGYQIDAGGLNRYRVSVWLRIL